MTSIKTSTAIYFSSSGFQFIRSICENVDVNGHVQETIDTLFIISDQKDSKKFCCSLAQFSSYFSVRKEIRSFFALQVLLYTKIASMNQSVSKTFSESFLFSFSNGRNLVKVRLLLGKSDAFCKCLPTT